MFIVCLKGSATCFYEKICFYFVHFWCTFEGTLIFCNTVIFWTYAISFRKTHFLEKSWTHGPKGPWAQGPKGPRAQGPKGPFWEGRGLQSTAPVSKNNDVGILAADLPDLAETVSAAAASTPPPHAPGAGMTVVTNSLKQVNKIDPSVPTVRKVQLT